MKKTLSLLACVALLSSCALFQTSTGADPFVVRVEQTQTIATATLDTFLKVDDSNRLFFRTNAAAAHQFAEGLRQWRVDKVPPDNHLETNRVWVSYLKSLNRVKIAYKAHTASSNEVVTVLATVESALSEAQGYLKQ